MKRIANYLIALAVAAFTFTSCEDVPSPFGEIVKPASDDVVVVEPSGTGTEADPYNVAGVLEYISGLGADVQSKGNTPETVQGSAYVYSVNGTGGGGGDKPSGDVKTVTIAEFLAAAESTSDWYQLTGTVKNLKDGDQYGNFDIEDATGSVYVYGLLAEKGGEKKKFQELVAAKGIKNGCKITIIGNRGAYNGTAQVANAYFVSVEAGGGDTPTPSGNGDGTENNPYDVTAAIAKAEQAGVFIKAFIVGFVEGQVYTEGATFSSASTSQTNILIAASADETSATKCMPVQLPTGDIRSKLNLKDNAGNYKKEVLLYGDITKYKKLVVDCTIKSGEKFRILFLCRAYHQCCHLGCQSLVYHNVAVASLVLHAYHVVLAIGGTVSGAYYTHVAHAHSLAYPHVAVEAHVLQVCCGKFFVHHHLCP